MAHKAVGSGFRVETDANGVIQNPSVTTDATGRFSLTIPRAFLPKDNMVTVTCAISGFYEQLRDKQGIPVVLEIHPQLRELDLENTFGKITVK